MRWAAQGMTSETARTAPSGRNIYPATIFVAVESTDGLEAGLYEYLPETHSLGLLQQGSVMDAWDDITGQAHPKNAPVTLFLNGNILKPRDAYGVEGGKRATYLELGHIGQNLYLQAEALELAMVTMAGLDADAARAFLGTTEYDEVLYLVPIGQRAVVEEDPEVAPAADAEVDTDVEA
jgi:SagB-type dehydrogenase family enzyme